MAAKKKIGNEWYEKCPGGCRDGILEKRVNQGKNIQRVPCGVCRRPHGNGKGWVHTAPPR